MLKRVLTTSRKQTPLKFPDKLSYYIVNSALDSGVENAIQSAKTARHQLPVVFLGFSNEHTYTHQRKRTSVTEMNENDVSRLLGIGSDDDIFTTSSLSLSNFASFERMVKG